MAVLLSNMSLCKVEHNIGIPLVEHSCLKSED